MKGSVCFFGIFDPNYARTKVLQQGFGALGYQVIFCRVDPQQHGGFRTPLALYREWKKIRATDFSYVVVCFPGQTVAWLARLLFGKKIILDSFLSLFDSNVYDRGLYSAHSLRGMRDFFLDWSSVRCVETVLLDTQAHINFFHVRFGVPLSRCRRVWIGADPLTFHPLPETPHAGCIVEFHGTFIPLQGVPYIVKAASLIQDEPIQFLLIGNGQETDRVTEAIETLGVGRSIQSIGRVPTAKVAEYMASADIVLGIFGDTEKTRRVIPNKVYEAMAMGKAIITADSAAVRELDPDGNALCLVPPADPEALAHAISQLSRNPGERARLGAAARALFVAELMPQHVVQELITTCPNRLP